MIQADSAEVVANRLLNWLIVVGEKENGSDALIKSGIFICDEERGSVDEGIVMLCMMHEKIKSASGGAEALADAGFLDV